MSPIPKRTQHSLLLFGVVLGVLFCPASPLPAQEPGSPGALRGTPVTLESLEQMLAQSRTDSTLNEAEKESVGKTLEEAIANLNAASGFESGTASLKQEFDQSPAEIASIRSELENRRNGEAPAGETDTPELPADATAEMIASRVASEKTRLAEMTRQMREWEAQLAELENRPAAIRERIIEVTRLLTEAETRLARWNGEAAASPAQSAEIAADQSLVKMHRSELALLEQESHLTEQRRNLVAARLELATSDSTRVRDRIARLEVRGGALVSARISEAERLATELGIEGLGEDPQLLQLLKETRDLSMKNQVILTEVASADGKLKKAEEDLERLRRDAENIRAQIEIGGLEETFSEFVLELRRELPTAQSFRAGAGERRRLVSEARLDAFRMEHEINSLPPTEEQLSQMLASIRSGGLPEEDLETLRPALKTLIETRLHLRRDATEGKRRLARILGEIEFVESEAITLADRFRDFLGEKLIWVASSPPLGLNAFTGLRTAFVSLLGPEALEEYAAAVARIPLAKWILAALLATALLPPRRRLRRFLADSAARTRKISTDGIGTTFLALGSALWLALPIPTLLWFFGWALVGDGGSTATTYALGKGLMAPALLLLLFRFSSILCRPGGVAESHFRWNRAMLDSCQSALKAATFLYLPAHLLLAIWFNGEDLSAFQGPGRLVFIAAMLSIALILRKLFRSTAAIASSGTRPTVWHSRVRHGWTTALTMLPVALALLAALGHFLTAVGLAYQIQNTAIVFLGGAVAYGLIMRWVTIKHRRIALQNLIAQREAKRQAQEEVPGGEAAETEPLPATDESFVPPDEEESIDWVVVGEQTRRLIRAVVMIAVLIGSWVTWSEVIPVLKYLDNRIVFGEVSFADLIGLGVLGFVTLTIFQNLPGLLEVLFLQALELEGGVRNAIITLCQYVVILVGAAIAFQIIGLDWSQFGWIAAALSVGLGFGLQEVVANFVSGIILLFERPIRVGDIVTVAGVDGVVSKIRIRATTITNWDRQEFIVPNKEFVTGTLLNWTLSSPITRLVFPIGIAYGSDIRKTREVLLEIARSQPDVLEEPTPVAVFEQFGDSTLNFSLRCFLPSPENRLEVTHRINTEIHDRFAEAGIEIPFPQRDLHLRSVEPSIRPLPSSMPGE